MRVLQKLYIKDFFIALAIAGIGLSIILSLINLIDKLDDFMKGNPSMGTLLLFAVLNIPKNLFYLLPMATLICSLFVFANAQKRNEIVIIKTSGGRIRSLLIPFIFIGLMLSAFAFFLSEVVMPPTAEKAEELKEGWSHRRPLFKEGTLWLKGQDGSIIRIGLYSYESGAVNDISIFLFDKKVLSERLEAEKALWDGETWTLVNVRRYFLKSGNIQNIKEMPYPNLESPKYFAERLKKTEEMGIGELLKYIKRLKQAGYRNPKLIVDFNSRLSYPFINLFMLILGVSLPLKGRVVKGLITSGIGLAISLLYWGGYILSLSLGNTGIVPPFLAPWLMPLIFAVISINLFRKLHE